MCARVCVKMYNIIELTTTVNFMCDLSKLILSSPLAVTLSEKHLN